MPRLPGFARLRVADPVKDKVKSRADPPKYVLEVRYADKPLFALNIYDDAQGAPPHGSVSCFCPPLTRHASAGDGTEAAEADVVLPQEALADLAEALGAGRDAAVEDVVDAALRPSDDPPPKGFVDEDAEADADGDAPAPDASAEASAPQPAEAAAPPAGGTVKNPLYFTAVSRRKVRACVWLQRGASAARSLTPSAADCEAA